MIFLLSTILFLTYSHDDALSDGTWTAVNLAIWTQMEIGMYLISACLIACCPPLEGLGRRKLLHWLSRKSHLRNPDCYSFTKRDTANTLREPTITAGNMKGFQQLENDEITLVDWLQSTPDPQVGNASGARREDIV